MPAVFELQTRFPSGIYHGLEIGGLGLLLVIITGRTLFEQTVEQEVSKKRICSASSPTGEKGLTSTQRTSIYSMPALTRALQGASPESATRLGRIGL